MKSYFETKLGKLYHGDCLEIIPGLEPVNLIVTSPPYDNLREYDGYTFEFEKIASGCKDVLMDGATLVWIVSDETKDGNESGTSFSQALFFKKIGLKLHDTMIYRQKGVGAKGSNKSYYQGFEYMFVFVNGEIKTVNRIADKKNKTVGLIGQGRFGSNEKPHKTLQKGIRDNVWEYAVGFMDNSDKTAHPAPFPEALVRDHILSWSNESETVLDIMCGSGTTLKMAEKLNRRWIGIEISEKYCEMAAKRIGGVQYEIDQVKQGKQDKIGLFY